MSRKSVIGLPAVVAQAIATLLLLLSAGVEPIRAQAQVPQELRARSQRVGRARVLVELKLPAAFVAETNLRTTDAVLAQRRAIAAAARRFVSRLTPGAARVVRRYQTVPLVAIEVAPAALDALATLDADLERIVDDEILMPALAESVPLIGADQAWASGFDGSGMTIAIIDSGIDSTHPFLAGKVIDEACFSSTVPGTSESVCPNGQDEQLGSGAAVPCALPECLHGTHVAGIAAGYDPTDNLRPPGVAKGANLMAIQVTSRVIDSVSCGGSVPCAGIFSSDVIAALEHVYSVALMGQVQVASVNLSLAGGVHNSPCDAEPYKPIIDSLRAIGVATVAASGNNSSMFGISTPACVSSAVSVGSTSETNTVSWFSNIAPFLSLLAPGESITSSVPGGSYGLLSGTSMAAPHVAGAWAVMRQADPSASVTSVLNAMSQTGLPVTDMRLWFLPGATIPRVRVFEALGALVPISNPVPVISSLSPPTLRGGLSGFTLTVLGSGFVGQSVVQWNGSPRATTFINSTKLEAAILGTDIAQAGTALVRVETPAPGGGTSSDLTFTIDPPPTLSVSASTATPGGPITVTLAQGYGGTADWLALATKGSPDTSYLQWTYVGAGLTGRTWTISMPGTAGIYEFRLFLNNGYTRAATSPPVTIDASAAPTLTVNATAVLGGASVTVTLTGGVGGASDWLALAATTAPNTSYLQWIYIGTGVTTRTWTVSMPVTGGTYEFRHFLNSGYTRVATSPSIAVQPAAPPVLSVSATSVARGASVTAMLTGGYGGQTDWLALASTTAANTSYIQWVYVGLGATTRTWTVTMPTTPGTYEFRLFLNNGYSRLATSPPVIVGP